MYAYPDVNTTVELLQYQNTELVGGMLGLGILIFIFVVLIIRLSAIPSVNKSGVPIAVASFVTTIVAILFKGMNLISDYTLIGCIVLSVVSVIILLIHSSN